MLDLDDLPEQYFASCLTDGEAKVIHWAINKNDPLLPIIAKLAQHISYLQDQVDYRYKGCSCDYENPGDVCSVHAKEEVSRWMQSR